MAVTPSRASSPLLPALLPLLPPLLPAPPPAPSVSTPSPRHSPARHANHRRRRLPLATARSFNGSPGPAYGCWAPRAAGPACASAPSARPRAGSRQPIPGSAAPALRPSPRARAPPAVPRPLPGCTVIAPSGPPWASSPLHRSLAPPGHLGPAHAQRTRRAALLEVAAPELEAAEDRAQEEGDSARRRPARRRQHTPGRAQRTAPGPKSGAATWPRLHLFAPLRQGRPGCGGGEDGDPDRQPLWQVICASGETFHLGAEPAPSACVSASFCCRCLHPSPFFSPLGHPRPRLAPSELLSVSPQPRPSMLQALSSRCR